MRILAAVISLSRFLIGVVFIANPKIMDQAWIGKQAKLPGRSSCRVRSARAT